MGHSECRNVTPTCCRDSKTGEALSEEYVKTPTSRTDIVGPENFSPVLKQGQDADHQSAFTEEADRSSFTRLDALPEVQVCNEIPVMPLTPSVSSRSNASRTNGGSGGRYAELVYGKDATYKGQVDDNRVPQGHGTYTSSLTTYEGQWSNGKCHNQGRQTWIDGRSYAGEYANNEFSGHGSMTWFSGIGKMRYEGQYLQGMKHGDGTFTWPSGKTYQGQWVNGQRQGRAELTDCTGRRREGFWHADSFQYWAEESTLASTPDSAGGVDRHNWLGPGLGGLKLAGAAGTSPGRTSPFNPDEPRPV